MSNVVGLDWDNITLSDAKKRQKTIEEKEKRLSVDENFCIRERYNDCSVRLSYSRQRYSVTGQGYDILFNMKKGFWRKMIG